MYFLLPKNEPLTKIFLAKALAIFLTKEVAKLLKARNYYDGKQKILQKKFVDGKPCNKIVTNFCYQIVLNYLGYMTGQAIKYRNDDFTDIIDILNWNDVRNEDTELLRQALIYGVSYECNYIDENGHQRFRLFDTRECFPIYDNSLDNDLLYVVRFYREDLLDKQNENYVVEVYGPDTVDTYRSVPGFTTLELISSIPHFYKQCPVSVFKLNEDETPIFQQIVTLLDGYNQLLSDEVDDFDSFADAYLILKGMNAEEEDLANMKRNRILLMDNDASADYLTKSISDTQITNMLQGFRENIYKITNCPDFSDEKFMAQSGVAIQYKLIGFEDNASAIEQQMRKTLQRRIELISTILSLTDTEELWRDVEIVFTRNLPNTLTPATPQEVMQYKGLVSDETLLELLPFVKDAKEELARVEAQKSASMDLYNYGETYDLLARQRDTEETEDTER